MGIWMCVWVVHVCTGVGYVFYGWLGMMLWMCYNCKCMMSGGMFMCVWVLNGLAAVVQAMDPQGPLFSGRELGMVDIMLIPYAFRFATILSHYRGFTIEDDEKWRRYHVWYKAALECDSVKKTLPDTQKLVENYKRYADDATDSQVAQAIRHGNALP